MSQITLQELSKTELKALAERNEIKLPEGAKHPEMVEFLTEALGSNLIDDGLGAPTLGDGVDTQDDESEEEEEEVKEIPKPKAPKTPKKKANKNGEYTVLAILKRNGEFFPKGSIIVIEEDDVAESLQADGTIE